MQTRELQNEYNEMYRWESDRRSELNKGVSLPMSLITAFSGIIYFVFAKIEQPWSGIDLVQIGLIFVAAILILIALALLVRSRMGYTYKAPPTPRDLDAYRKRLVDRFHGDTSQAEAEVVEYIFSSYTEASHRNAENNERRGELLYKSMQQLVFALPIIIVLGFVQMTSQLSHTELRDQLTSILTY